MEKLSSTKPVPDAKKVGDYCLRELSHFILVRKYKFCINSFSFKSILDNPLQCSCLENPRDGGAWWAAVSGVASSWTRLKWLSSSSSSRASFWAISEWTFRRSILKIPYPKFLCRFVNVPVWQGARVSQPKNNSMAERLMVMLMVFWDQTMVRSGMLG